MNPITFTQSFMLIVICLMGFMSQLMWDVRNEIKSWPESPTTAWQKAYIEKTEGK